MSVEKSPVRLGSLGLGWWGGVLANAAQTVDDVEVAVCYARTPESRASFASAHECREATSLDDLLADDIEGVLIATPHTTHADLAIAAIEAGKHVFVDKPLTLTVADADRVLSAAEKSGVVVQVGHNRRRQPAIRKIKEQISGGGLGSLLEVTATHSAPLLFNPNLSHWRRELAETPAGGMSALGVHQVDNFHYLVGEIARVFCWSRRMLPEGEVDDVTEVLFEFASGALGHLSTSMATGPVVELTAWGTDAIARSSQDGGQLTIQSRGDSEQVDVQIDPFDTIADELIEFASAVRGEGSPEIDGGEARRTVAVLEAIVQSAETDSPVDVNYD